jgi:iron complex outermembrane receptor protein
VHLTERWYSGGVSGSKNGFECAPGTCPALTTAQLIQTPTYNYQTVSSIFYFDVGANWNVNDKTQVYTQIDNITNIRPPDQQSNTVNNTLYDVIGRMYRVGVRFTN